MIRRRLLLGALAAALLPVGSGLGQERLVTSLTLFAGTPEGLWRSEDWGGSWERVVGSPSGVRLESLGAARAIVPLGPQVYVAGEGGLARAGEPLRQTPQTSSGRPSLLGECPGGSVFAGRRQPGTH